MSHAARSDPPAAEKRFLIAGAIGLVLFVVVLGSVTFQKIVTDPDVPFLFSEHGADWIRFREPLVPQALEPQTLVSSFRTHFHVDEIPGEAILSFRAMKQAAVWLDNQLLHEAKSSLKEWKHVEHVDLAPALSRGPHELRIAVRNQNGHPALLAYCKPLGLHTGENWEGTNDDKTWTQALSVNRTEPLLLSRRFQPTHRALFSHLHSFIPVFLIVSVCSLVYHRQERLGWLWRVVPTAKGTRWVLLGFWVILAINNMVKLPLHIGMDFMDHMEYIDYVAEKVRIPLATEGSQMFQSPLFYVISAVIYKSLLNFFSLDTVLRILRVVPLLCGAAQIELSYRAVRYAYPTRQDLQVLGTVIGGLVPMNIYMSQAVGNEPMTGCLSGLAVVLTLRLICSPRLPSTGALLLMGLFLGLALLTKVTALLLVFPIVWFIAYRLVKNSSSTEKPIALITQRIVLVLGVVCLISGWYYLRNWIETGSLFIGGWDPLGHSVWWQDPGYRTPGQLLTFGEALFYPIYSAAAGFWDSLYSTFWMDGLLSGLALHAYRPPWNYGFLLSSAWFSLLPSGAIFLGILVALCKPTKAFGQGLMFAVFCVIVYISAILYLFLTIPIYSTAKATYTLGLIPCYAVLSAAGFDVLTRGPLRRAIVFGVIACWAVGAYVAYFVC